MTTQRRFGCASDEELWRLYRDASDAARKRTTSPRTDPPGAYGLREVYDAGRRDALLALRDVQGGSDE